ncbi:MAG TPA: hypothetical protein VHV55_15110 [Pirellulales bacterium]|jgi:hypothetical protein|nr:hypothetical protein [Pirellulales bacterium]
MNEQQTPSTSVGVVNTTLLLIAGYGILTGIMGLPVGLFVGPHILVPAVCHLAAAIVACVVLKRRLRQRGG